MRSHVTMIAIVPERPARSENKNPPDKLPKLNTILYTRMNMMMKITVNNAAETSVDVSADPSFSAK